MTLCYDAERAAAARRRRTGAPALLERLLGDCLHALPPAVCPAAVAAMLHVAPCLPQGTHSVRLSRSYPLKLKMDGARAGWLDLAGVRLLPHGLEACVPCCLS